MSQASSYENVAVVEDDYSTLRGKVGNRKDTLL
jgi:hypothetical protein